MTTAATSKRDVRKKDAVAPFGIEIDVNSNSDVIIQSIPGCRLRGKIRAGRFIRNAEGDEDVPDSWMIYGKLPTVPGRQLHVHPETRSYRIIDPLHEDDELCDRLKRRLASLMIISSETELRGCPPEKGTLDADRMKTLVREMTFLVKDDMAKVVKGVLPDKEDIDLLPGEYLLNPGSQVPNGHPRYEKDWDDWYAKVTSLDQ